jgi:hypothetical protein
MYAFGILQSLLAVALNHILLLAGRAAQHGSGDNNA